MVELDTDLFLALNSALSGPLFTRFFSIITGYAYHHAIFNVKFDDTPAAAVYAPAARDDFNVILCHLRLWGPLFRQDLQDEQDLFAFPDERQKNKSNQSCNPVKIKQNFKLATNKFL